MTSIKKIFKKLAVLSIKNLRKFTNLQQTVIHWDIHPGNMLLVGDNAAFFDYEFAHLDYRIFDIANTISILAALNPNKINYTDASSFLKPCKLNLSKTNEFIKSYHQYNPLTRDEVRALVDAIIFNWIVWSLYTIQQLKVAHDVIEKSVYLPTWIHNYREDVIKGLSV